MAGSASEGSGELELVRGICRAFGSVSDDCEAGSLLIQWVRRALDNEPVAVRALVPESQGRLRMVAAEGERLDIKEQPSATRHLVFDSKQPHRYDLSRPRGHDLMIMPLVSGGESVGVVEVVAPRELLDTRREALEVVTSHGAILLGNLREKARLEREVGALQGVARLAAELISATCPDQVVRTAIKFCFELGRVPVAAWRTKDDPRWLHFVGADGLGAKRVAALRDEMQVVARSELDAGDEQLPAATRFASLLGVADVTVIDASPAVLLVGAAPLRKSVEMVGSLVKEALRQLTAVTDAARQVEGLHLGIAGTAHEFRGPLLGMRAVADHILEGTGDPGENRELLQRSAAEMKQLAELVDGLLRWSVGLDSLSRSPVDFVQVVDAAVITCCLAAEENRVVVTAPVNAIVMGDARQLRIAIANVVRNAMVHSTPDRKVEVEVERAAGFVTLSVKDEGPGIPPSHKEAIFDPFVSSKGSRGGTGLGLFIARRVIEGHGGEIWVDSNGKGATFRIRLAVEQDEDEPCGS